MGVNGYTKVSKMATRSLKEKQRKERELLILQAAEEVMIEKGYHETSMEEIAARVGIAKGTVYLHFPSKEDLVVAIFERDMQKFLQALETPLTTEGTAQAKLQAMLQFMFGGLYNKRTQLLSAIYNSADLRRLFVEKKGCMHDMWERLAARITDLIEQGKAAGEFDTTIPTAVMLNTFLSLLSPRNYERLIVEKQMPADELVKYLGRIYFKGIAAK